MTFAEGRPFREGIQDFLTAFRSTPSEDGVSPAELLHGWRMRISAQVLPDSFFNKEKERLEKANEVFQEEVKSLKVEERKKVVAARYQNRRYGRKPIRNQANNPFRLGDWVRVKKPSTQVLKGQSPFAGPYRIIQVLGRWTFRLSDMNVWNCRRLSRYQPSVEWQELEEEKFKDQRQPKEPTNPAVEEPRRSSRSCKGQPPKRFCEENFPRKNP
ncbi:MAG: hypothetical protein GY696_00880 [Gammaproteobacteria bacterium]|nr:hypothetical protein [Gammaproteobacteria bacterium]